ncbi:hypothetical protein F441_18006 [Phytophthora nicotianae CJ01A1]|uniref:Uncharacterized protein n=1 Tax=Phytophthora nicotianae CJ01A1 TaxID=1317063 RepID=W2W6Y8_PHYNI|nr:hypothetical protein F441_18006 [Phytophthora nicotianae CJ01A1]
MAGELDDLEARRTTGVSEDNEEYDKELEDRLIGLDEVALKERVKKNAERQKSVSLGELYKILDIPEDVLARTCEAAPGELSCPEYWLEWSTSNEEAVLEVERENNVPARTDSGDDKGELEEPGGVFFVRSRPPPEKPKPPDGSIDVDEFVVQENVVGSVSPPGGRPVDRGKLPAEWRGLIRRVVYLLVGLEEIQNACLVPSRILEWIGRSTEPLRGFTQSLNAVSGHSLKTRGVIDLQRRLGSLEKTIPFVVVDQLHVDAILEDNMETLKGTGEAFPIGSSGVEESYRARISSAVRICPGGQAVVVADTAGQVEEGTTALVEGLVDLNAAVRVARTLCSIQEGKVIVEICNPSTEDIIVKRGTPLAAASIVPEAAFSLGVSLEAAREQGPRDSRWIDSTFRDLIIETSLRPDRTDLLEFSIDTGDHPTLKQHPYRVSGAEGDVMEAEIKQYLELGFIGPSNSPWAVPY